MQDKTWYSILGLDAEPLFLQDHMLKRCIPGASTIIIAKNIDNMLLCVVQILMKQTLFKLVDFLPSQPESSIKILCEKHGV